jgi:hypothetical protein
MVVGCGGSGALTAGGMQVPGARFVGVGEIDQPGHTSRGPDWRETVAPGDRLEVSVRLRNTTAKALTVTGLGPPDPDRDGYWRPDGVEGAPVDLPAHAGRRITLLGHASACGDHLKGQILEFGTPEIAYRDADGRHRQEIGLGGTLELVNSACPPA